MTRSALLTYPDRADTLSKAVVRSAEILGLKQAALARVLGMSPATVSRLRTGQYRLDENRKEWELAALLVRLYRGLDALMASDEAALRAWMRNPNTDLHEIPANLIVTIPGLVNTLAYVDAHRARV